MVVSHHLAMNNWVAIKTHPETNPWTLGAKLGASARVSFHTKSMIRGSPLHFLIR